MSFGRSRPASGEQPLEVRDVVVPEDLALAARLPRMPAIIEAWLSASERIRQSGSSRAMVEIAASFETKPEVKTSAASLPWRSASSSSSSTSGRLVPEMLRVPPAPAPTPRGGLVHRRDHGRVLAHAEIVVGAPDDDLARPVGRVPDRARKIARAAFEIGEDAVALLGVELIDRAPEDVVVTHARLPYRSNHNHSRAKCRRARKS